MKIILVIVGLIVLLLIVAAVMPKDYTISAQTTITAPKQEVFDYVKYIKNQDNYSVRNMADPGMKKTTSWTDGTVGFIYARESTDKNVGVGEQEITHIADGEFYEVEIRFKKPFVSIAHAITSVETVSDTETKVTTMFIGRSPFPTNLMSILFKWTIEEDMQTNLDNLKKILEN